MIPAAITAALAAALLIGPSPLSHASRIDRRPARHGPRSALRLGAAALVALAVGVLAAFGVGALVWVLIGAVSLGTIAWLWVGHRRRSSAARGADDAARSAKVLSSLLRAGQIPTAALAEAAQDCPVLAPAAAAARLGADVGEELERSAALPGQQGMGVVAAAWQVSERSGAPIADVLATVADNLRRERQLGALIEAELSAARASGRIMAALPFLAIGLGFVAGADPLRFLFGDPLGRWLMLGGVLLTAAGVLWIDRLSQPDSTRPRHRQLREDRPSGGVR